MNKDSSSGQTAVVKWFLSEGGLQNMCSIFKPWKESVKFKKKKKLGEKIEDYTYNQNTSKINNY